MIGRLVSLVCCAAAVAGAFFGVRQAMGGLQSIEASAVWFTYAEAPGDLSLTSWQLMVESADAAQATDPSGRYLQFRADGLYGVYAMLLAAGDDADATADAAAQALTALDASLARQPTNYRTWLNRAIVALYLERPADDVVAALANSYATAPNAGNLSDLRERLCRFLVGNDPATSNDANAEAAPGLSCQPMPEPGSDARPGT